MMTLDSDFPLIDQPWALADKGRIAYQDKLSV